MMLRLITAGLLLMAACTAPNEFSEATRYALYFHGRLIEDHGLPAVSPEHGPYEYEAILDRLTQAGFTVLSEIRGSNANVNEHAERAVARVDSLLRTGVPPDHITLVGASKGAYIAALTSHLARNPELNVVLLAGCSAETVAYMRENGIDLYGDVLAIRDIVDTEAAGPCADVFAFSDGVCRGEDLVVKLGVGHGLIFRPYDEWVQPTTVWGASKD